MDRKKNEIIQFLKIYKQRIAKKAKIDKMLLFCSQARGDAEKEGIEV